MVKPVIGGSMGCMLGPLPCRACNFFFESEQVGLFQVTVCNEGEAYLAGEGWSHLNRNMNQTSVTLKYAMQV